MGEPAQETKPSVAFDMVGDAMERVPGNSLFGGTSAFPWVPLAGPPAPHVLGARSELFAHLAEPRAAGLSSTQLEAALLHTHWASRREREDFIRHAYLEQTRAAGKAPDRDEQDLWLLHYERLYADRAGGAPRIDPVAGAEAAAQLEEEARRKNRPFARENAALVTKAVREGDQDRILAAFRHSATPGDFLDIQANLDMEEVIGGLDDWTAVQVGMLGPLRSGAQALNRKRARYIVHAVEADPAAAEVFVLYMLGSMYTDDVRAVVELLAKERHLARTVGQMEVVRREIDRRGIRFSPDHLGYHDEKDSLPGGLWRGFKHGTKRLLGKTDAEDLLWQRRDLPPAYAKAFDDVVDAEAQEHFSPKSIILGELDYITFGVPGGLYGLVAGTARGVRDLARGDYEAAGEELTAAAIVALSFLGMKAVRLAQRPPAGGIPAAGETMSLPLDEEAAVVAERLIERIGEQGLVEVARELRADSRAAILVHDHGERGIVALHEAGGDVVKARAQLAAGTATDAATAGAATEALSDEGWLSQLESDLSPGGRDSLKNLRGKRDAKATRELVRKTGKDPLDLLEGRARKHAEEQVATAAQAGSSKARATKVLEHLEDTGFFEREDIKRLLAKNKPAGIRGKIAERMSLEAARERFPQAQYEILQDVDVMEVQPEPTVDAYLAARKAAGRTHGRVMFHNGKVYAATTDIDTLVIDRESAKVVYLEQVKSGRNDRVAEARAQAAVARRAFASLAGGSDEYLLVNVEGELLTNLDSASGVTAPEATRGPLNGERWDHGLDMTPEDLMDLAMRKVSP